MAIPEADVVEILAPRRLTERHRETAGKDDERFLLLAVHVTLAAGTGLVSPDIRARLCPKLSDG